MDLFVELVAFVSFGHIFIDRGFVDGVLLIIHILLQRRNCKIAQRTNLTVFILAIGLIPLLLR